jgi:hypothetical protein
MNARSSKNSPRFILDLEYVQQLLTLIAAELTNNLTFSPLSVGQDDLLS